MDSFLLAYIRQRMCELGFSDFHFEPVRIVADADNAQIQAYNEYYYLTSQSVPSGLTIASDTNIFNETETYYFFNLYKIQEFTGLIEINQGYSPIDLEFIKVIPTCAN